MGISEVILLLFLIGVTGIGFLLIRTLDRNLVPIRVELFNLRNSLEKLVVAMESHIENPHPHTNFEEVLEEKFVKKDQLGYLVNESKPRKKKDSQKVS